MRRAAKDRARAVVHHDEIRDIDRQFPCGVKRMAHRQAGVIALLFGGLQRGGSRATLAAFGVEGGELGVVRSSSFASG